MKNKPESQPDSEAMGTVAEMEADERLLKEACARSIAKFAVAFFPHCLKVSMAQFHRDLYRQLYDNIRSERNTRDVTAAPRGHAKTTAIALILPLWCICYPEIARKHFILIATNAKTLAEEHIGNIQDELEHNERLKRFFPEATGEGPTWTQKDIVTKNNIRVAARSTLSKSVRGIKHGSQRPDLLIGEELENDENVLTPDQRTKTYNWLFKAFTKTVDRYSDICIDGTILHYDSVLSRLLNNPAFNSRKHRAVISWAERVDLWEHWERIYTDFSLSWEERERQADKFYKINRKEMLKGAEVLWEAWIDYYELMKRRIAEGPASFDSEYQNEPINPEDCLFQEAWFQWFEEDDLDYNLIKAVVGACDPSMGKDSKKGDPSGIISLAVGKNGDYYVLDADIERRNPDKIIEDCLDYHVKRNYAVFGIESVQMQEFFAQEAAKRGKERFINLPVKEIPNCKNKDIRIRRRQPLVKNGAIKFQKKHITFHNHMRFYDKADHDEGPDMLDMAVQMAETLFRIGDVRSQPINRSRLELERVFG